MTPHNIKGKNMQSGGGGAFVLLRNGGESYVSLDAIYRVETGESNIIEQFGYTHDIGDANLAIIPVHNGRILFLRVDLESFRTSYQRARGGDVVEIQDISTSEDTFIMDSEASNLIAGAFDIGERVDGKGIYFGTWSPRDTNGQRLNQIFDVYAAPQDLTDKKGKKLLMNFDAASKYVSGLQDWHGHNGSGLQTEQAIHESIRARNFEELGKWFIPPIDLINGQNGKGRNVSLHNLKKYKDHGALKGSFTILSSSSNNSKWYFSSTGYDNYDFAVRCAIIPDGTKASWLTKDSFELSTRLVRAEPRL